MPRARLELWRSRTGPDIISLHELRERYLLFPPDLVPDTAYIVSLSQTPQHGPDPSSLIAITFSQLGYPISSKMGAGSSKEASLPAPKLSSDGAPIAPDRTQRSRCWEARDIYYGCLDKHDILDSIAEKEKAAKVCAVEGRGFEANCASSWVRKSRNVPRIWYMCMGNIGLTML